jgi:hypothetical protein
VARALVEWLVGTSLFNAPGLLVLLLLPPLATGERSATWHVLGVVGFSILGVALQGKFFDYHLGAAIPLTGLLAGWGYWKAWIRLRASSAGLATAVALAIAINVDPVALHRGTSGMWGRHAERLRAWLDGEEGRSVRDSLDSLGISRSGTNRRVAEWIARHTDAGDTLFVWGFEPVIYVRADRRPASRYVYNVPQRVVWGTEEHRRVLMDDLARAQPAAVVVEEGDVIDWVVGNERDSRMELEEFPALRAWLSGHYAPAERIDNLEVYLRTK